MGERRPANACLCVCVCVLGLNDKFNISDMCCQLYYAINYKQLHFHPAIYVQVKFILKTKHSVIKWQSNLHKEYHPFLYVIEQSRSSLELCTCLICPCFYFTSIRERLMRAVGCWIQPGPCILMLYLCSASLFQSESSKTVTQSTLRTALFDINDHCLCIHVKSNYRRKSQLVVNDLDD